MNFTFQTLIQLEDYHYRMTVMYNHMWNEVGDEYYVARMMHLTVLNAIRKEIEREVI